MVRLIRLPSSLLIDITNEAATQVLLWMRQDYRSSCPWMLKDIVGAGDALDNPAFALQTALNVTAVGKHVFRTPSPNLSRRHARQGYPATLGIAKTELSIFSCRLHHGDVAHRDFCASSPRASSLHQSNHFQSSDRRLGKLPRRKRQ